MRLPATARRSCLYTLEHCRGAHARATSGNHDGPAHGAVVNRGLPQSAALSEARPSSPAPRQMGAQSTGPRECPRIEQLLSTAVICGWHVQRSTLCCCLLACLLFDECLFFSDQSSCGRLGIILGPGAVLGCTHIHLCGHTHTHVYAYVVGTHACMQCAFACDAM